MLDHPHLAPESTGIASRYRRSTSLTFCSPDFRVFWRGSGACSWTGRSSTHQSTPSHAPNKAILRAGSREPITAHTCTFTLHSTNCWAPLTPRGTDPSPLLASARWAFGGAEEDGPVRYSNLRDVYFVCSTLQSKRNHCSTLTTVTP